MMAQKTRLKSIVSGYMLLALLAGTGVAPMLQAEEFYKWVDADGVTHYTRNPPPDQSQTHLINTRNQVVQTVKPEMPAAAADNATDNDAASASEDQAALDPAQARAQMQQQCAAAQANVDRLEPSTRVLTTNDEGETVRMDDDQRLLLLEEAKDFLADNC